MLNIALTVIKLALIAGLGFILYRRKFIDEKVLRFLTFFVINISIPCLFFSQLIKNYQTVISGSLWFFLAASLIIFLIGLLLGFLLSFKKQNLRREFLFAVSLQNAGYLPMNIAYFFLPENLRGEFLVYIFLYLLGFNILMWSVASFFIFKRKQEGFRAKSLLNLPVLGTLIALFFIYTNTANFIPALILSPVMMVGETSFVLSMIILGSWLAKVEIKDIYKRQAIILKAAFIKLVILPALAFFLVLKFEFFSLLGLFLVLEAAMPSAASLPIVADMRGGDGSFTSQCVFITHLLSVLTVPVWVGLYLHLVPFIL